MSLEHKETTTKTSFADWFICIEKLFVSAMDITIATIVLPSIISLTIINYLSAQSGCIYPNYQNFQSRYCAALWPYSIASKLLILNLGLTRSGQLFKEQWCIAILGIALLIMSRFCCCLFLLPTLLTTIKFSTIFRKLGPLSPLSIASSREWFQSPHCAVQYNG